MPSAALDPPPVMERERLEFLDGIRGLAMLAVFLYHSLGAAFGADQLRWSGWTRDFDVTRSFLALYPLTYGFAGVAMFFVVSGFCIHLSHSRSRYPGWLYFLNRRFFRIYPPYLVAIVLFAFFWPYGFLSPTVATEVIFHILAIQNFDREILSSINPAFWSIAVEIQLYLIYPLLLLLIGRLGWYRGLLVVAAIELGIRAVEALKLVAGPPLPTWIVISVFSFWFSWALGAYLADCFREGRASGLSRVRFDLTAIAVLAMPLFKPTSTFTFCGFALLTAIAIDRLIAGRWRLPDARLFRAGWTHLRALGAISYSFYLIHLPILSLTRFLVSRIAPGTTQHPLVLFALCCAWYLLVYACSFLLWRYIEQPSIAFGARVWRRFQKGPAR